MVTVIEILSEQSQAEVSTPATPEEETAEEEKAAPSLPARSAAVQKIAELSRDPTFRSLIKNRETPKPKETPL